MAAEGVMMRRMCLGQQQPSPPTTARPPERALPGVNTAVMLGIVSMLASVVSTLVIRSDVRRVSGQVDGLRREYA